MQKFMNSDFMLQNDTAKHIFHSYCEDLPIFDYHCHLSAKEIWENKKPENITQLWLGGDHYKWRAMRANGISEDFITGDKDDYSKFEAYARMIPNAIGNPLYHWTHLELQRYFHIYETLSPKTCKEIWEKANHIIESENFTPRAIIEKSNVYALCTTEDPADTLEYHKLLKADGFGVKVLPAFRPDTALEMWRNTWPDYMKRLEKAVNFRIASFSDLKKALLDRMEEFAQCGCVATDHGFEKFPCRYAGEVEIEEIFQKALRGEEVSNEEIEKYQTELMLWLAKEYDRRNWAMELHIGPIRSRNTRMVEQIGEATGFDSIGDHAVAVPLASWMNTLEVQQKLPKTILFSINNKDNMVLATMAGNFQDSSIPSKIQMGTAWWFQDHRDGMEEQMKVLANEGLLGHFIGMLTDSRSFLSYPRHEYFRRIMCNLIGTWVENGEYPADEECLKQLVSNIAFYNAKNYFGI